MNDYPSGAGYWQNLESNLYDGFGFLNINLKYIHAKPIMERILLKVSSCKHIVGMLK